MSLQKLACEHQALLIGMMNTADEPMLTSDPASIHHKQKRRLTWSRLLGRFAQVRLTLRPARQR